MKLPSSPAGRADPVRSAIEEAVRLSTGGRHADALKALEAHGGRALKTAAGRLVAGNILLQQGNAADAVKSFDAAIRLAPAAPEAHANRGAALHALGRLDDALAAEERSLRLRPDYAAAHFHRGNILSAMGRGVEALDAYARALRLQPAFAQANVKRGHAFGALDRWTEALEDFTRASRLAPRNAAALLGQAMAHSHLGQRERALAAVDAALAIDPGDVEALMLRCDILYELERYADVVAAADRLMQRNPDDTGALAQRARALVRLSRATEALATADRLVELASAKFETHIIRGAILAEVGQFEESLTAIEEARRLSAPEGEYLRIRALVRSTLGDPNEALADFEAALAASPGALHIYSNRASLRLAIGDWPGGWDDHEWRLKQPSHLHNAYVVHAPKWAGEPLDGKRLLVYAEQGLGDTLQFMRYLPLLVAAGAAVTLLVPEALQSLFAMNFPQVDVRADPTTGAAGYDYQISLMSLSAAIRDTLETLPRDVPYIVADPQRVAKWRERISDSGSLRVGIVWQGGRNYLRDATRSIPLSAFAPLAAVPGVRLYSVQAQVGLDQLDALPAGMQVTRFGEELENNPDGFQEMAAIMANLDLLVMSDTGPTHLAGALGRSVWLALSRHPDWRWMRERPDSPWYPTMRLFRQRNTGDWDEVFARIAAELAAKVAGRVS